VGADSPDKWAREKRSRMERRTREWGDLVERASNILTPGVPVAAHLGFAANGSRDENTTGWISCSDREREEALKLGRKPLGGDPRTGYGAVTSDDLHELGAWGVEGGHVPERVATGDCPWVTGARSDGVRKVLDRAGVEGHEWHGAHEDQIAIGVWNLSRHSRQIRAKVDPRLSWAAGDKPSTLWRWALTMMSWSAGTTGAARHVARYADALAALPEAQRWGALVRLASTYSGDGRKHARPSYSVLRTCQKLEAARAHADDHATAAWFADGLDADRAAVYARLVEAST
jgi:hypothetical protein